MNLRNRLPFYISLIQQGLEWFGYPLICTKAKAKALKNLTLWGKSLQNGTPTPTAPITIESVGDKTRNMFNKNTITTGHRLNTISAIGKAYGTIGPTLDFIVDGAYCVSELMEVEANATYIKNTLADAYHRVHFYDANKICVAVSNSSLIHAPADAKYMAVCMSTTEIDAVQVEKGDTTTEYVPYGYQIPLILKGKNLWNPETIRPNLWVGSTGDFVSANNAELNIIEVEQGSTYTFTNFWGVDKTDSFLSRVGQYDSDMNLVAGSLVTGNTLDANRMESITVSITNPNTKYLACSSYTVKPDWHMIKKNDTTTEYVPFINTTTNIYLNEPLRKIGEYADIMNVDGTTVTVTRNMGKVTYVGTEDWRSQSTGATGQLAVYVAYGVPSDISTTLPVYPNVLRCDVLSNNIAGSSSAAIVNSIAINNIRSNMLINVSLSDFATLSDWLSYVTSNPLTIYYVKNAPTIETYTIPDVITLPGECVITTETTVKPSDMYGKQ